MDLDAFGFRIVERREKLRLTQRDVAAALQVSAQAVSKWERGENAPDVTLLASLSRVLGVSTDWLLGSYAAEDGPFEGTVFASDIVDYSTLSRRMEPRDAVTWLNARFFEITEVLLRFGGIPISYVGDVAIAVFAGPGQQDRALQSALAVQSLLGGQVRIGLDSGPVHMWTLGHPAFSSRNVLGGAVDRAARLAGWKRSTEGQLAATSAVISGAATSYGLVEQPGVSLFPTEENMTIYATTASPAVGVASQAATSFVAMRTDTG